MAGPGRRVRVSVRGDYVVQAHHVDDAAGRRRRKSRSWGVGNGVEWASFIMLRLNRVGCGLGTGVGRGVGVGRLGPICLRWSLAGKNCHPVLIAWCDTDGRNG